MIAYVGAAVAVAAALASAPAARADCKLVEIAEFHVDPKSSTPLVDGEINGKPVKIAFDTGATTSMVPLSEARRLGLAMGELIGQHMYGVGGETQIYDSNIKELKIGAFKASNLDLMVAGDRNDKWDASLILGDDFFARTDVEFDLRHGAVRLFDPQGCTPPQLIYWGSPYSQAAILPWNRDHAMTQTMALVNGKQVLAEFDTGSEDSLIDIKAAEAVGASFPDAAPDKSIHGLGPRREAAHVAHFDRLALGDETLSNIRLQVLNATGDWAAAETGTLIPRRLDSTPYMLIGADFFHAHRVFIDNKDHLILFSYEGGPVFAQPPPEPAPAAASGAH